MLPEVDAEEEAMVDYKTYMPPNMPARDFNLRLYLYLNSEGEYQGITVFNEVSSSGCIECINRNRFHYRHQCL